MFLKSATASLLLSLMPLTALAQGLPDIYADAPIDLQPTEIVASFPRFTFIENMIEMPDGRIVATSTLDGTIYQITHGDISVLAVLENTHVLCLEHFDGDLIVTANYQLPSTDEGAQQHLGGNAQDVLLRLSQDGHVEELAQLEGVSFANGIARAPDGRYLIAASGRGEILFYDPNTQETGTWLSHPVLAPGNLFPMGVNGLRVEDNQVYFANTGQMTLGRIDYASQKVDMLHQGALVDDFAVAPDGTVYGATHAFNSVVAFAPDGSRRVIAGADQGATGSTSVRFDAAGDLLVSTGGNANYYVLGLERSAVVPSHVLRITSQD